MGKQAVAFFLLMGLMAQVLYAQRGGGKISGMVGDEQKSGLEGATVVLRRVKGDDTFRRTVLTGKDGGYVFMEIPTGNYRIYITAVGYSPAQGPVISIGEDAGAVLAVGWVQLKKAAVGLDEVTVRGDRPMIEQRTDRIIVNVDASVTNTGSTALEVLQRSPGVMVDKDGSISLKGKQGVTMMLDGKPSYLSGADLAGLLGSMNANQLDQIEIMTNPPARYDAEGNAGIINIKTKKNRKRGFNGILSLGYGQGKYWKTNGSLNLNYRTDKYNLFFSYTYSVNRGYTDLHIMRSYLDPDGKTVNALFDEPTYLDKKVSSNNVKLGMDYFLRKRTTLGWVATGFISPRDSYGGSTGNLQDASGHTDSLVNTASSNDVRVHNGTINLNLRHSFDSTHELSADLDYITYHSVNPQLFTNTSMYPDGTVTGINQLRGDLPSVINIYSGKADYSQVIGKGTKFEGGWKSSLVRTDNSADYFNLVGGNWEPDYGKTNDFTYRENINAVYVNLNREQGRWTLQGGLRYENTSYMGHQLGNPQKPDSAFSHRYNDVFPTVFVSYQVTKYQQFTFSAGRRIDRPSYQLLNPFLFFINRYTYQRGNPFLQPQYTTNAEIGHVFKGWLTTTVNYSRTTQYNTDIFRTQGDTTILSQGNLGTLTNAGISVNAQLAPAGWWALTLHLDLGYKKVDGFADGAGVRTESMTGALNGNSQLKFGKGWTGELSGFYNFKDVEGQFRVRPNGLLAAGLATQCLQKKGTIKLSVQDIFFWSYVDGSIAYQNVREHFIQKRDARVGNISFTYRFGKVLKGAVTHDNGGAREEQNRVKL